MEEPKFTKEELEFLEALEVKGGASTDLESEEVVYESCNIYYGCTIQGKSCM